VVTEPTQSGKHDLERVTALTGHFGIRTLVCINKWDLNPEMATEIETAARAHSAVMAGKVRYDNAITQAQIEKLSVVEYTQNGVAQDIKAVWAEVARALF
jgi:MinD superfamily P-loop ATPase